MIRSAILLLSALLALQLPAGAASADDESAAAARRHLNQAKVHYKLGEFEKAIVEYKEAYRYKPVPAILFNLAQALRMAGDFKQSRFQYENYLRDMPNAPNKQEVERQIAQLSELIAEEEAKAGANKPTTADDPVVVVVPGADPDPQPKGEQPKADDPPPEDQTPSLAQKVLDPQPQPVVESSETKLLPIIVSGVAAVLAVAGGVTYGLARGDWSDATSQERPRAEVDALIASGDSKHTASLGLAGAAVLAGGGAAFLFVF